MEGPFGGLSHFWRVQLNEALNTPIRRSRRETVNTDLPIGQKDDIVFRDGDDLPREQIIVADATTLEKEYSAQLAMSEEPITIIIHPSREKNPPQVVDCWVNGRGAEVFVGGRWQVFNCLPVNIQVTTKRKYVEVLLRAKPDTIETLVEDQEAERPSNRISRATSSAVTLSVLEDRNPKGAEWLRQVMRSNY